VLEKLIKTLMVIAVEHAGAERGLLILPQGEELGVAAEARTREGVDVQLQDALVTPSDLPDSLLHYVIRTRESMILDDASTQNLFSQDEYVRQRRPRSVLCLPLVKQVNLVGILYLENSLAPRVFTAKRLAMLEMLASQAAISLDHAQLYSERKRAEEALQKAQTELAHISRVTTMGELATSIAHEINQPLGAIANNVNACLRLLGTGSENLQEVERALSDITKGVDRVNSIIVRMRALAKKVPPEMARLRVEDVVSDVLTLTHYELTRRHVAIHTELSKDLPPILGDRIQLQQVLLNLVMNGVEAMNEVAEGEQKISIRARRHEHKGRPAVLVSVQDGGVGLNPAEADRLFEAFYTTKAHGIGMGLAISRSIIEAHGGRLWVAGAGGPGATFEFTLPTKS
jgi:C4-dicarboxylate-specific signal transduction histidine kinase